MAERRDLQRILRAEIGHEATDRVWPVLQRELPELLRRLRDDDDSRGRLADEVRRLQGVEGQRDALLEHVDVLLDELRDAWWVRAGAAFQALRELDVVAARERARSIDELRQVEELERSGPAASGAEA